MSRIVIDSWPLGSLTTERMDIESARRIAANLASDLADDVALLHDDGTRETVPYVRAAKPTPPTPPAAEQIGDAARAIVEDAAACGLEMLARLAEIGLPLGRAVAYGRGLRQGAELEAEIRSRALDRLLHLLPITQVQRVRQLGDCADYSPSMGDDTLRRLGLISTTRGEDGEYALRTGLARRLLDRSEAAS